MGRACPPGGERCQLRRTVTFTEQQLQVVDQLVGEGTYGDDRQSVIKRLLALYAEERLATGAAR
jgi:Arc/MetJ-type ribon-helix-helix transcriptional regulator